MTSETPIVRSPAVGFSRCCLKTCRKTSAHGRPLPTRHLYRPRSRFCHSLQQAEQPLDIRSNQRIRIGDNEAAKNATSAREAENVYAIGVQGQQPQQGRGKQASVIALPGLWADIDVLGPNHGATSLPPTIEEAWSIVQAIPLKPTVVVHSGWRSPALLAVPRTPAKLLPRRRDPRPFASQGGFSCTCVA